MTVVNGNAQERSPLLGRAADTEEEQGEQQHGDSLPQLQNSISKPRAAACIASLGVLIIVQATNFSILTVTQSVIADELDAFEGASWFTSAYLIALSSLAPLYGKLAQIISPRVTIFVASIIIAVGSLATAFAHGFTSFVVGRAVTGSGSAGVLIIALIVILELATPQQRGIWLGLTNMLLTTGVSAGAALAGALLPVVGWRALFWIQSPIVLLAGVALFVFLPARARSPKQDGEQQEGVLAGLAKQDYLGAVTLTLGLVLLLLAVSNPRFIPVAPIIAAVAVLAIFVAIEVWVAREPIIPMVLLRSRGLFFTCAATIGYMMARWTVLFYAPTYAIAVRGWSAGIAGSMLIPTNAGFASGSLLVGWLHIKRNGSFYIPSLITYALFPITLLLMSFTANPVSHPALFIIIIFFNGIFTGASLNYTFAHLLHLTPKETHYMATSIVATFRGFAGSFASAAGGGYFVRVLRGSLQERFVEHGLVPKEALIRRLLGSPATISILTGPEKQAAIEGYSGALKALWLGAACLSIVFIFLQAAAGWKAAEEATKLSEDQRGHHDTDN